MVHCENSRSLSSPVFQGYMPVKTRSPKRTSAFVLSAALVLSVCASCDLFAPPTPPSGGGGGGGTTSIVATLLEQLSLERINRARLLPGAEATAAGIAIDEGIPGVLNTTPKPAVAMNTTLRQAAIDHSQDMLNRNYFEHDTPEGVTPFDRMRNAGYLYNVAGENLAWRGSTGTLDAVSTVENQHDELFIDVGIAGRGHRVTMLNEQYREVGIGIVRGSYTRPSDSTVFSDSIMQTQDFGTDMNDNTYVLGVVYTDTNGNGQYDYGEGTANSTVTLGSTSKTTNDAGGYSFEVSGAGTFTLTFASGMGQTVTITAGGPNIKVDHVGGVTIVVNLGVGFL